MNKFDKTVINGFIKLNNLKGFIKNYRNNRQAILYYARHAINEKLVDELTKVAISFNDAEFLADYALELNKKLNTSVYNQIIFNLAEPCISYHNYKNVKYLCRIARHVTNLSKKQKEHIFNIIASSDRYFEIYRLAKEAKLDKSQKSILTGRISSCNDCNLIEKYLKDVNDLDSNDIDLLIEKIIKLGSKDYFDLLSLTKLSDNNKENLIDAALATNNADYIFSYFEEFHYAGYGKNKETFEKFIDKFIELKAIPQLVLAYIHFYKLMPLEALDTNSSSKVVNALVGCDEKKELELSKWICHLLKFVHINTSLLPLLKNKLVQIKEPLYIAEYIILQKDKEFLKNIFGDTLSFCLFCMSNKLCNDMNELINLFAVDVDSKEYQNYVDDNIEKYNKNVAIKK